MFDQNISLIFDAYDIPTISAASWTKFPTHLFSKPNVIFFDSPATLGNWAANNKGLASSQGLDPGKVVFIADAEETESKCRDFPPPTIILKDKHFEAINSVSCIFNQITGPENNCRIQLRPGTKPELLFDRKTFIKLTSLDYQVLEYLFQNKYQLLDRYELTLSNKIFQNFNVVISRINNKCRNAGAPFPAIGLRPQKLVFAPPIFIIALTA